MIREADTKDIGGLTRLIINAWDSSCYAHLPLSMTMARAELVSYIDDANSIVLVSDIDGICGVLIGTSQRVFISSAWAAHDVIFYVERGAEGTKLIKRFVEWAESRQCELVNLSVSYGGPNIDRVGKLIERQGFECCGSMYNRFIKYE